MDPSGHGPRRFGRRPLLQAAAALAADLGLRRGLGRAEPADPIAAILAYHERSKHRPGRLAAAPERVEWRAQPDPFRRFEGAPLLPLDEVLPSPEPTWDALVAHTIPPRPVDRAAISQLLYDALALSAWKEGGGGSRWSLRVNPSSGNLHPVEAYLVGGPFPGVTDFPALLHYAPHEHALERRATLPARTWAGLAEALPPGAFLAALTSIDWREAWKYGERGFRYCLLDAGHAIAALAVAAAGLGWRARVVATWSDRAIARLVGADRQEGPEAERAEALLAVWPGPDAWPPERERAFRPEPAVLEAFGALPLAGRPNRLSVEHRAWPGSEEAVRATTIGDELGAPSPWPSPPGGPRDGSGFAAGSGSRPPLGERGHNPGDALEIPADRGIPGRALIRGRRTALGFEPGFTAPREAFLAILARTMPGRARAVFAPSPWPTSVHLALLVHRVEGFAPGLYLLPRAPAAAAALEAALGREHRAWQAVDAGPALPLRRLAAGDLRERARAACCDQDTAADGAFTAALLVRFEPVLREDGAAAYRRLHREAGALGHALYLEAEAAGLRGTAMGCFLDDELHALLGLRDRSYQVLYTFAIGRAVDDPRLRTAAPYAHLRGRATEPAPRVSP